MTDSDRAASAPWRWWHMFAVDLRSLALFRVALGICLLVDPAGRIPQITAFYTDAGILPRDALVSRLGDPWSVSLHLMSTPASTRPRTGRRARGMAATAPDQLRRVRAPASQRG